MANGLVLLWVSMMGWAHALGTATSGGGGAFVWYGAAGQVTTAKLVDLWEAENIPFNWPGGVGTLNFASVSNNDSYYIQESLTRLALIDETLAKQVRLDLDYVLAHQNRLLPEVTIDWPEDVHLPYSPRGSERTGVMYFDGVTGLLNISGEVFDHLTNVREAAASYLHEAIYKTLRESANPHTDSVLTRHLNACLLSESKSCLQNKPLNLPSDRWVFRCSGEVADYYVYPLETKPPYDRLGYRIEFLRFGQGRFSSETFIEMSKMELQSDGSIKGTVTGKLSSALDTYNYSPGLVGLEFDFDYQGILNGAAVTSAKTGVAGGISLLFNRADNSVCAKVH